ncbi:hypothetical protein BGW37DRAFT_537718 [Umbelopsis sp. PMI_123]|nr:hypothetical protein BGW37DRAFT_537718 [Umbelopsis sp. PMI_123]
MGAQIDATITSVVGVALAICWAIAGMAASVSFNRQYADDLANHQVGVAINAAFLIVGVMFAQLLRTRFPKFQFFSLQFMIVQIFCNTKLINLTAMDIQGVLQFGIPLILGAGISLFYNLVLWRETAIDGLGRAMHDTVKGSQAMLKLVTDQFELEFDNADIDVDAVNTTAGKMRAGYAKIMTAYKDSKYEISHAYISPLKAKPIYKSLNSLTKHLSILGASLRSEKALFEAALNSFGPNESDTDDEDDPMTRAHSATQTHLDQVYASSKADNSISHRRPHTPDNEYYDQNQLTVTSIASLNSVQSHLTPYKTKPPKKRLKQIEYGDKKLFVAYLESLRDPLLMLSKACTRGMSCVSGGISYEWELDEVRQDGTHSWAYYFGHIFRIRKPEPKRKQSRTDSVEGHCDRHCDCPERLRAAIAKFDTDEHERMETLKRSNKNRRFGPLDLGLREEVFLVFFFIFCLREVAKELEKLTVTLNDIKDTVDKSKNGTRKRHFYFPNLVGPKRKWRKWASFSSHQTVKDKGGHTLKHFRDNLPHTETSEFEDEYRLTRIQTNLSAKTGRNRSQSIGTQSFRRRKSSANKKLPNSFNNVQEENGFGHILPPARSDIEAPAVSPSVHIPFNVRVRYWLWKLSQVLSSYDCKFTIKMALAVLVLAIPAYIPSSQAWYANVRGQWAAVTVIAIMNPTTGGTINGSIWRVVGTLIGSFMGWGAIAADGGPYIIVFFGFLLSMTFFYVHLATSYNRVSIVVMIAYEIVAVGGRVNPMPGETTEMMVLFLWPFVARHQLKISLSDVIFELGEYYAFIISAFLYDDVHREHSPDDIKSCEKQERNLQRAIVACRELLNLTFHEPGLKAPFPTDFYDEMIITTQNLLDRLCNLKCAVVDMPIEVRKKTINPSVYLYRRDMTAALLLHFHTLSVSLKAKKPLPAYMPSARLARIRLMNRRREYHGDSTDTMVQFKYLTWFAMASSSEEIIEELEHLTVLIRYITGESKNSHLIRTSGVRLQERQRCHRDYYDLDGNF